MTIVPATEQDLTEIISWISTEADCRLWAGPAVSYPLELPTLSREILFSPETSFSCIEQENLLAFGQILPKATGHSHLARIIANPQIRGQGFGRAICRQLVDYASALSNSGVTLNVYRSNTPTVALYTSLGFVENAEKSTDSNIFMVKE